MPSINTYIVEIDFQSVGNVVTSIQAESANDAKALLGFFVQTRWRRIQGHKQDLHL